MSLEGEARPAWRLVAAPAVEPRSEANWQALGDFLALAEAVGRIGGALSQQAPIGPEGAPEAICAAMQDAHRAMRLLALRAGIDLESRDG
jgi:hypothetical protein